MPQIVIGLSGRIGAGKTTVARRLADQYGFWHISISDLLKRLLIGRGITHPTRDDFVCLAEELKALHGADCIARMVCDEIRSDPGAELIVLDGVRFLADNDVLNRTILSYVHVHVHAGIFTRLDRIQRRKEKPGERGMTFTNLIHLDTSVTEQDIEHLAGRTDLIIDNSGSLGTLNVYVSMMLAQVRKRLSLTP